MTDESAANWVVRKVVSARQYAARVKAWAASEVKRAEREEAFFLWRFGPELEAWCDRQLAANDHPSPKKSLNLPAGTVGRRTVPSKLEIVASDRAMSWARRQCQDAIQVTEKLSKSALNEHFADTGELPDGTTLTDAEDVFYIK